MNTRIKAVRDSLRDENGKKMTQSAFANEMHVTRDMVATYEGGRVEPSALFIDTLCNKYGVNETWLRTGEGEMFKPKDRIEEIADITAELMKNESMKAKFIKAISNLSEEQLLNLYEIGKQIIEDVEKQKDQH